MSVDESEFDRWAATFVRLSLCLHARREGPHKVACNQKAKYKSKDGYPACARHRGNEIRPGWRGYVEGA